MFTPPRSTGFWALLATAALSASCGDHEMLHVDFDAAGFPQAVPVLPLQQLADGFRDEVSKTMQLPWRTPVAAKWMARNDAYGELLRQWRRDNDLGDDAAIDAEANLQIYLESTQLLGFYDPRDRHKVWLLDDVAPVDRLFVMRHELVHALQDQHWPLEALMKQAKRAGTDAVLGLKAAVEGQAEFVMKGARVATPWTPWAPWRDGSSLFGPASPRAHHPVTAHAPPLPAGADVGASPGLQASKRPPAAAALQALLQPSLAEALSAFPYVAGQRLVEQLQQQMPLAALIRLTLDRPPISSQQVLHVDAYLNDVRPTVVALPAALAHLQASDVEVTDDTFGELRAALLLDGDARAFALASAWRGDRLLRLKRGPRGGTGTVWTCAWKDADAAAAVMAAVTHGLSGIVAEDENGPPWAPPGADADDGADDDATASGADNNGQAQVAPMRCQMMLQGYMTTFVCGTKATTTGLEPALWADMTALSAAW